MARVKKRESYKSANAANKAARVRKPDATRCGLCGAMCTDPTEVSRHHENTCSRYPDNAVHHQTGADSCACGNLWPCTRMTGPGKTKRPKKPRPPWPRGPSVIPPPKPRNVALFNEETGMPWEHIHETTGSNGCNACFVEATAPRVGGQAWADFTQELISKLGFMPRYPGLTDEQHLIELVGPRWAEDVKKKWVVNWTVDGWLARRPHLTARARLKERDRGGDGVGAEHSPSPRWSVFVTKRGVHFQIDHQGFMLKDDYDPDDGWNKEAYYKWYAKQLTIAFKRLLDEQ